MISSDYTIRDFELFDLLKMNPKKQACVFFNVTRRLTWDRYMLPMGAFLQHLPHGHNQITKIVEGECTVVGQVMRQSWESFARLNYVISKEDVCSKTSAVLVESLIKELVRLNSYAVVAEIEINSPTYSFLREIGFSTMGYQKVWRIPEMKEEVDSAQWRIVEEGDRADFMGLYKELTAPVIQNIERPSKDMLFGMVYEEKGEKIGFAEIMSGPVGVCVRLLIHPKIEEPEQCLLELTKVVQPLYARPLYFIVPSHLGWLDYSLSKMNADVSDLMAVMAKTTVVRPQAMRVKRNVTTRKVAISGANNVQMSNK